MSIDNQTLIIPEKLGERIKALRVELGYSQTFVADDFISVRTLQKIEKGETTPTFEVLLHIANKLRIEMFDLVLSSRIPYYLESQFPALLEEFLTSFEQEDPSMSEEKMKHFTQLLNTLNQVKLPYEEQKRFETIYAILQAFTHQQKDAALELLTDLLLKLITELQANPTRHPDDNDHFLLAAYARLQHDESVAENMLQTFKDYPSYYYHPTTAYNIGLAFYKTEQWSRMEKLAIEVLDKIDAHENYALLPFIYCQLGVAKFMQQHADAGVFFFDKGLELLMLFRQKENFELMVLQAQNDGLPIANINYHDYISESEHALSLRKTYAVT